MKDPIDKIIPYCLGYGKSLNDCSCAIEEEKGNLSVHTALLNLEVDSLKIKLKDTNSELDKAVELLKAFIENMECQCDTEPEGVPCEYHLINNFLQSIGQEYT